MSMLLVIETGLHEEQAQMEAALAYCDKEQVIRRTIDLESMIDTDWDDLLEEVLSAKAVITL